MASVSRPGVFARLTGESGMPGAGPASGLAGLSSSSTAASGRSRRRGGFGAAPGRRALWRRAQARRVVAALLLGAAVWAAITAFAPPEPEREQAVTLTRDLPAGYRLAADDLTSVPVEPRHAPASRLTDSAGAVGQVLAHSVERGEVLTAARLRPARELTGLALDERALHVPVSDRGSLALVRPGDRVDVVSAATGELVGTGLLVLSIDAANNNDDGESDAAGLVLAVPPVDVGRIVPAAVGSNADGVQVALRADRPPP